MYVFFAGLESTGDFVGRYTFELRVRSQGSEWGGRTACEGIYVVETAIGKAKFHEGPLRSLPARVAQLAGSRQ